MADNTKLTKGVDRPQFYILHEHVELKQKLGGGNFGDVFAGRWKKDDNTQIDVAVKTLKGVMQKKQRSEFVKVG